MAAPYGNKNGRGKKGASGRKSAYQEMNRAKQLDKAYFGIQDPEKLNRKLKGGRYSIWHAWQAKALAGNERAQTEMFKKAFPDLSDPNKENDIKVLILSFGNNPPSQLATSVLPTSVIESNGHGHDESILPVAQA